MKIGLSVQHTHVAVYLFSESAVLARQLFGQAGKVNLLLPDQGVFTVQQRKAGDACPGVSLHPRMAGNNWDAETECAGYTFRRSGLFNTAVLKECGLTLVASEITKTKHGLPQLTLRLPPVSERAPYAPRNRGKAAD